MDRLKPHLKRGVMIAVGAVFKFYSGVEARRAPKWIIKWHLEFVYRIFREPKKQLKRCGMILFTLPELLLREIERKRKTGVYNLINVFSSEKTIMKLTKRNDNP